MLAGNIVLDILDYLAYDPNWYDPEAFSHTRQYKAQMREQEKYQNQPDELSAEEIIAMTDDEMKNRQGEVWKPMDEEEAKLVRR